ncbi:hypothetical protein E1176_05495 [Fulvivirga sp. RKSG066]|uniref:hypothetical protein n=1 Tax=Fulvivirga aurantia TaxID=2529383 RepID=UPI0012BCF18B|nr:hypothetical protein [Fulvivirga aurantia]MTI20470.1 hypothetical protein [Fulvivirga aurantia]
MRLSLVALLICIAPHVIAQEFVFNLPQLESWYEVAEGDTLSYQFEIINRDTVDFQYRLSHDTNITFDSTGYFRWIPDYDMVSRVEESTQISVLLEAFNQDHKISKELQFTVLHKNRPPIIESLPVFYVKQYTTNEFNLNQLDQIKDPDEDPIVFKEIPGSMPQGASLSALGTFKWQPSRLQFRQLSKASISVEFIVQDQPEKTETKGSFEIAPTQLDLPPEILIVPSDSIISGSEDDVINLSLYITDPNGDDNIMDVGFVSNNAEIPKEALIKNTDTQWEFKWTPGYDFLDETGKTDTIALTFFAIDKTRKENDKTVFLSIKDAENIEKKDERLFAKYRLILLRTMNLIDQLDENQKKLNKQLKKAKKGKKNRAIVNASLGAVTGVSPLFIKDDSKDYVTGIGGTAVLTLGTLEATEVMGRSKDDILDRLKINIDIRNKLQEEGDRFARKYALKTKRRNTEFNTDIDKLKLELNNKKLILLELPADWENSRNPTDKNLRKTFPDFNNEGFEE